MSSKGPRNNSGSGIVKPGCEAMIEWTSPRSRPGAGGFIGAFLLRPFEKERPLPVKETKPGRRLAKPGPVPRGIRRIMRRASPAW